MGTVSGHRTDGVVTISPMGEEAGGSAPGPGWWLASDGNWYPPELHPDSAGGAPEHGHSKHPGTGPGRAGAGASAESERLHAEAMNWAKGAEGERITAQRLAALPARYVVFHDLHVPGSSANVDHLVIGPTGVFMVDSKAYSGEFTDGSGTLWQGGRPMRREVDTAEFISGQVAAHLGTDVQSVLCFTEAVLPRPVTELGGTMAVTLDAVCSVITAGPTVHSDAMIEWLSRLSSELVEPTPLPRQQPPRQNAAQGDSQGSTTPPNRAGPKAKGTSRPGRRKKKASVVLPLLTLAALAMLLPFLPTITKSVGEAAAKQIVPATPTTLPAEAGITFSCPVPSGGYTGVLVYPKDGSIFRVYEIVVRAGETEIYRDRWQIENMPPPPLTGLWPGVELVVSTSTLGAVPVTADVEVPVPSEPC